MRRVYATRERSTISGEENTHDAVAASEHDRSSARLSADVLSGSQLRVQRRFCSCHAFPAALWPSCVSTALCSWLGLHSAGCIDRRGASDNLITSAPLFTLLVWQRRAHSCLYAPKRVAISYLKARSARRAALGTTKRTTTLSLSALGMPAVKQPWRRRAWGAEHCY